MKLKKKIAKKPTKSAAPKASAKSSAVPVKLSSSEAVLALDVKAHGLEPVLGAAYLMMDKAFVALDGDKAKTISVVLRAKDAKAVSPRALADEFLVDLESQKVRWAVSKNNQPVREYIAEQAVLIANGTIKPEPAPAAAPEPAADELTDDQRLEIEKLIAEVESEIKTMQADKTKSAVTDPKGVKASWEEKQENKAA